jgi:dolichol-phosphate mannosyltransferase
MTRLEPLDPSAEHLVVLIPVLNERENIRALFEQLTQVLTRLETTWQVLFVDDGSTDGSDSLLDRLATDDPRLAYLRLSRNFGHNAAIAAGLQYAEADAVIVMDGDQQDTPDAIPEFMLHWRDGAQVVYAIRSSRTEHGFYRLLFWLYYQLLNRAADFAIPMHAGAYCLLDRNVVQALNALPEPLDYIPGLRAYVGFKQVGIEVPRRERYDHRSRVGLWGLIKLAADAFFSFSEAPLKLLFAAALGLMTISVLAALGLLIGAQAGWTPPLGWGLAATAIVGVGGLQLATLAVIAYYQHRLIVQRRQRPDFVVAEAKNVAGWSKSAV